MFVRFILNYYWTPTAIQSRSKDIRADFHTVTARNVILSCVVTTGLNWAASYRIRRNMSKWNHCFYTPRNEVRGVNWIHPVCLSLCPSVCPLTFRVRPVASTVQDGLFPYLVQMINSMRGCVACDDLWPWPISSRSFGLDLENRVRSVASTILDGFFCYLAQMITINRGCVACYVVFRIIKFERCVA